MEQEELYLAVGMGYLIDPKSVAADGLDMRVNFGPSLIVSVWVSQSLEAAMNLATGSLVRIDVGGAMQCEQAERDSWTDSVELLDAIDGYFRVETDFQAGKLWAVDLPEVVKDAQDGV